MHVFCVCLPWREEVRVIEELRHLEKEGRAWNPFIAIAISEGWQSPNPVTQPSQIIFESLNVYLLVSGTLTDKLVDQIVVTVYYKGFRCVLFSLIMVWLRVAWAECCPVHFWIIGGLGALTIKRNDSNSCCRAASQHNGWQYTGSNLKQLILCQCNTIVVLPAIAKY